MSNQHQQQGNQRTCYLEFDGACRGNPGPAGAGAILRDEDGCRVYNLREGVGYATNNIAEFRGLILGLKQALGKGYQHIHIHGDSHLVYKQVRGEWSTNNHNLRCLCNEAKELLNEFKSHNIIHIPREHNRKADRQANMAITLGDGQVEVDRELQ